jgi:alpha-tubulin suppressor-like RCC1 family protein
MEEQFFIPKKQFHRNSLEIDSQLDSPLKNPSFSLSEILQLCLLFIGSFTLCLLLGCFIGGFANVWDSIFLFFKAIALGTGWGLFVLISAFIVSSLVLIWASKTRLFANNHSVLEKTPLENINNPSSVNVDLPLSKQTSEISNCALPASNSSLSNVKHTVMQWQTPSPFVSTFFANPNKMTNQDIFKNIAHYLNYGGLYNLMQTCKHFWNVPEIRAILKQKPRMQIIAGKDTSFLLTYNGKLYGCGCNNCVQLGLGPDARDRTTFTPITIPDLKNGVQIQQVAAGVANTLVLLTNGQLYGCGANDYGQLGLGDAQNHITFTSIIISGLKESAQIQQVVAGWNHTFVLLTNGQLYGCGDNYDGQLGLGDYQDRVTFTPIIIPNLEEGVKIQQVVAGSSHTLVLLTNGQLYGCGGNFDGELGLGDKEERTTFTLITIPNLEKGVKIQQVVTESSHTLVLLTNGQLYGCGDNDSGQLGLGDSQKRTTFTQIIIPALKDNVRIQQVVTGWDYTLVLLTNGQLYGCGANGNGQLGLGNSKNCTIFTQIIIPELKDDVGIQQVVTGSAHTLVLLTNEQLYGCGDNSSSQLGLGDRKDRTTFTLIKQTATQDLISQKETTAFPVACTIQ